MLPDISRPVLQPEFARGTGRPVSSDNQTTPDFGKTICHTIEPIEYLNIKDVATVVEK